MTWLISGVVLWALVHFVPTLGAPIKSGLIAKVGENGYKGIFALCMLISIGLIVYGWRSTDPDPLYDPPSWAGGAMVLLMINAFALFGASHHPSRIKRFVRHPQLTSVILWSIAHLIGNGDTRSVVLFAGLGLWAIIEIWLINARDGEWIKPDAPSMGIEIRGWIISLVIFMVALFLHPYFAGVAPILL